MDGPIDKITSPDPLSSVIHIFVGREDLTVFCEFKNKDLPPLLSRTMLASSVIIPRSESFRQVVENHIGQFSPKFRVLLDSQSSNIEDETNKIFIEQF